MWILGFTRELHQWLRNIHAIAGKRDRARGFIGETALFTAHGRRVVLLKRNVIRVSTESECYENVIYLGPVFEPLGSCMRRRNFVEYGATLGLSLVGAHARAAGAPLRVGLTAVILADQAAFLARWSEYLSERMELPVSFVARESYQAILDLLFSNQIDAAWVCGYPYVRHQTQLRLLAVPVYQGRSLYQSYLIRTRGGSAKINGWGDLKNRVLAYSDPLSNSGWLVAQAQLRAAGLTPQDLRRGFFAHGHSNVAEAVASGLAHAGCIDGYVWETMQLQKTASVANTQVIWKSELYGFPPIVVRQDDRNMALEVLGQTLMGMHEESQGQDLLRALNLNAFATPAPALYDSIRELVKSVHGARA